MMPKKQAGLTRSLLFLWLIVIINSIGLGCLYYFNYKPVVNNIPNLLGTWSGKNVTISDAKGYREWAKKTIQITEQKDRRFRGVFTYADGTKHFFGVIYPDNISFTWVSTPSKGFVQGRILDKNTIGACYLEAYEQATAGCATLKKVNPE